MARPVSISAKDLSGKVKDAVANAKKKHSGFGAVPPEPDLIWDPYWLIGFILRELEGKLEIEQAQQFASTVAGEIQGVGAAPAAALAQPGSGGGAVYLSHGHIIMGYRPVDPNTHTLK
jgi:hypothetical protein